MLACISIYGKHQGHRRVKLKESLITFLNLVQQHFPSSTIVLLCAPDDIARLSVVRIMDSFQ